MPVHAHRATADAIKLQINVVSGTLRTMVSLDDSPSQQCHVSGGGCCLYWQFFKVVSEVGEKAYSS